MYVITIILVAVMLVLGFCTGLLISIAIINKIERAGIFHKRTKNHEDQRPDYGFNKDNTHKRSKTEPAGKAADPKENASSRLSQVANNSIRTFIDYISEDEDGNRKFTQQYRHRQNESYNYLKKKKDD